MCTYLIHLVNHLLLIVLRRAAQLLRVEILRAPPPLLRTIRLELGPRLLVLLEPIDLVLCVERPDKLTVIVLLDLRPREHPSKLLPRRFLDLARSILGRLQQLPRGRVLWLNLQ